MSGAAWHEWRGGQLILRVHVQPRAAATAVIGQHGARLKVRVKGLPREGEANAELCRFLAGQFNVARSKVNVVAGHGSREKTICIDAPAQLPNWMEKTGG